jgi:hypothetical protein
MATMYGNLTIETKPLVFVSLPGTDKARPLTTKRYVVTEDEYGFHPEERLVIAQCLCARSK